MPHKVLIDCDPGIGDAVALALALHDPELDVVAVTATAGCVSGQNATRNIQALVETLDPPKWPRIGTSDAPCPLGEWQYGDRTIRWTDLHGPTGLGDRPTPFADLHHQREAAKLMIELVRDQPHEITLLTLGPLTNVAVACERAPEFPGLLRSIVCLGGSIERGGDVTAVAEFNVFADPEAARTVLLSRATKTLVPLDVSREPVLTFDGSDRLPDAHRSPLGGLLADLLPFALRANHQHFGIEGLRLPEIVAVAAISRPRLFRFQPMDVDVETSGELTRGMTVFDRRGTRNWQTNIDVAREVDSQAVLDYFVQIARS